MSRIKIGCETYTWQMPGEQYKDKLRHIMEITSQAGFEGIEPETSFMGDFSDPGRMLEATKELDLELAVLCLVEDWLNPNETDLERAHADQWIEFLAHFPETLFLLVQMPGNDRAQLETRQQNLLKCVNTISRRAADKGIVCSYHPNSPPGSIFRTEEDYKILLGGLDSEVIKYTPDVGHIAKVGMDPLAIIRQYRDMVNCVHYKDMYHRGEWAQMGSGDIDFDAITKELTDTHFGGWIIMEDECDRAISDPDGVTIDDGVYLSETLKPSIQNVS